MLISKKMIFRKYNAGLRFAALIGVLLSFMCTGNVDDGEDTEVTLRGSLEITGKLLEIREEFPPNDLYDYAYVLKYEALKIHRGTLESDTVFVGHYNPLKSRNLAADDRVPDIGGNVTRFHAGDVHRMALEVPIDNYYMGGIIDKYFDERTSSVYWAVWTNRGAE